MADDTKTISLGFSNGLSANLKLVQKEIDKLVKAIEAEDKWVEVHDEKRVVTLRSDRIDFYGLDAEQEERTTGFG